MKMVDLVKIKVMAGNGGNGLVSFKREKYLPKGGPDGGNGGNGGNVYIVGESNMATLIDFRSKPVHKAKNGQTGMSQLMTGQDADDLYIKVPLGTLVYELVEDEYLLVADIMEPNQSFLIAQGGRGGRGNASFKSSVNQAPRKFTKGTLGEVKYLKFEMKLIADVGFVGFPNAGKSTLINHLTNARAKIGSYPFTTLNPNLGLCTLPGDNKIIIADIPGLIEGAHEGKGLGDDFLRHIERTRIIVHLIDPMQDFENMVDSTFKNYQIIRKELENKSDILGNKKEIVVINKLDLTEVKESFDAIKALFKKNNIEVLGISAVTGEGLDELLQKMGHELEGTTKHTYEVEDTTKVYTIKNLPNKRVVFRGNLEEE
jgi:GTP-binding protein